MEKLTAGIQAINGYLSDYVLIVLLLGAGLYLSFRTHFVQVRCLGEGFRQVFGGLSFRKRERKGGMSSFQALATAIAQVSP